MSAIATAVFKATVGLLVQKARDKTAERLKNGDVSDQMFRRFIMREMDDIKSKLDGIARTDLLASFSSFKGGLIYLYQLFETLERAGEIEDERKLVTVSECLTTESRSYDQLLSTTTRSLQLLDPTAIGTSENNFLAIAKERFGEARMEAKRAFSNEALGILDRILAMKVRVCATILEHVTNPSEVLPECCMYLEELHAMTAVQEAFRIQMTKGLKFLFSKVEREEVITSVFRINRVIYDVTQVTDTSRCNVFTWPCIQICGEKVDPLRDRRIAKNLPKVNAQRFGEKGENKNHVLKRPWSIACNTQGYLIVEDSQDRDVKVFNSAGTFVCSLHPVENEISPRGVATDKDDNIYVLNRLTKHSTVRWQGVCVFKQARLVDDTKGGCSAIDWHGSPTFDQQPNLHHKFPLRGTGIPYAIATANVSGDTRVIVLVDRENPLRFPGRGRKVEVYDSKGTFINSFGKETLKTASDVTTNNHGHVIVLDPGSKCVHVFTLEGSHFNQFTVQGNVEYGAIVCHDVTDHIVISSQNPVDELRGQVSIYTSEGEFVRSIQLGTETSARLPGVAVNADGRIVVTSCYESRGYIL